MSRFLSVRLRRIHAPKRLSASSAVAHCPCPGGPPPASKNDRRLRGYASRRTGQPSPGPPEARLSPSVSHRKETALRVVLPHLGRTRCATQKAKLRLHHERLLYPSAAAV